MSRKPNTVPTAQLRISTTPQVVEHLERLAESGLYGKNPAEAAERLIAEGIRRLISESILDRSS
jgi:hypothetical protein